MFKAFLAAVIGSVIAFMWSWISWSILPGHESALKQFSDEAQISSVLKAAATEPGIYIIPGDKSLSTIEKWKQ